MNRFKADPINTFNEDWALVTAGTLKDYNTMTISWGGMGTLWGKPVVTVYVKPVRFTHDFMEKNENFTVSFFDEKYRKDLAILGKLSGRDSDKVAMTSLTPVGKDNCVVFNEAKITLICKKMYKQDLDMSRMPDFAVNNWYTMEAPHTMYIGEVIDTIIYD